MDALGWIASQKNETYSFGMRKQLCLPVDLNSQAYQKTWLANRQVIIIIMSFFFSVSWILYFLCVVRLWQ